MITQRGAFPALRHHFERALVAKNYSFVETEQDLTAPPTEPIRIDKKEPFKKFIFQEREAEKTTTDA